MENNPLSSLITWKSDLYEIQVEVGQEKSEVTISARQFYLDQQAGRLAHTHRDGTGRPWSRELRPLRATFNANVPVHSASIVTCSLTDDIERGSLYPCLLLIVESIDKKRVIPHMYCAHLTEDSIKLNGRIGANRLSDTGLGDSDVLKNQTFYILNTSVVSVVHDGIIYFMRFRGFKFEAELSTFRIVDLLAQRADPESYTNVKALGCTPVDCSLTSYNGCRIYCKTLWLIGVHLSRSDTINDNPWDLPSKSQSIAMLFTSFKDHTCNVEFIDGPNYLPNIYVDLTAKLQFIIAQEKSVLDINQPQHKSTAEPATKTGCSIENTLVIFTINSQFLQFKNGNLEKCLTLDIPPLPSTRMPHLESCSGTSYYVVHNDGAVTVVNAQTFEVKEMLSGYSSAHVADFTGSGGDQILCVSAVEKHKPPDSWTRFLWTDFYSCYLQSEPDKAIEMEDSSTDSVGAAVQALEGRLQASCSYVSGVEREFQEKVRLIQNALYLTKMLSEGNSTLHALQTGLMPLLGAKKYLSNKAGQEVVSQVRASAIQYKTFEDTLVVLFSLENQSNKCLHSVKATLIPHQGSLPGECKVSFLESLSHTANMSQHDPSSSEIPTKRRRIKYGHQQSLTTDCSLRTCSIVQCFITTQLPCFSWGQNLNLTIAVSWIEMNEEVLSEIHIPSPSAAGSTVHCQVIGKLHVPVKSILEGSQEVRPEVEITKDDLLVMDAVQISFVLCVQYCYTPSCELRHVLQSSLHFQWMDSGHCWMCLQPGQLKHVRLQILHHNGLIVHVRSRSQLFLLISALYSVLPDDAVILPYHKDDIQPATSQLLHSIHSEAQFVRNTSRNVFVKKEPQPEQLTEKDESPADKVTKIRADFAHQQALVGAGDTNIDSTKHQRFLQDLHTFDLQTADSLHFLSRTLSDKCLI